MYTHTPLFPSKPEQKCHTGGSAGEIKEGEHTAADWFISFTPGLRGSAWLGEGCWGRTVCLALEMLLLLAYCLYDSPPWGRHHLRPDRAVAWL